MQSVGLLVANLTYDSGRAVTINEIYPLLMGVALLSATTITGCTSGGGSAASKADGTGTAVTRHNPITISPMASIPAAGVGHEFSLRINNDSKQNYTVDKIEVIDPLTEKSAEKQVVLNTAACDKVAKGSFCTVGFKPLVANSSAYIIKATLSSGTQTETASQLIRINQKMVARDGIYFNNDINEIMADSNGKYSLSLPIVLNQDFQSIKVTNGRLDCESKSKGSACTYTLAGSVSADKSLVATNVELITPSKTYSSTTTQIKSDTLVRTNRPNYARILLSQPLDIKAELDGTQTPAKIVAFNLGNESATNVTVSSSSGFTATSDCNTLLSPGSTCGINVTLAKGKEEEKELSITGSIGVKYKSSGSDQGKRILIHCEQKANKSSPPIKN